MVMSSKDINKEANETLLLIDRARDFLLRLIKHADPAMGVHLEELWKNDLVQIYDAVSRIEKNTR